VGNLNSLDDEGFICLQLLIYDHNLDLIIVNSTFYNPSFIGGRDNFVDKQRDMDLIDMILQVDTPQKPSLIHY